MAESIIPVDLFNPGQVFACLGFMELADVLLGEAEAGFDWTDPSQPRFHLSVPSDQEPVPFVLKFISSSTVIPVVPLGYTSTKEKNKKGKNNNDGNNTSNHDTEDCSEHINFKYTDTFPASKADEMSLPVRLYNSDNNFIESTHWADGSSRSSFKLYSGNRSAAHIINSMLHGVREKPGKNEPQGSIKYKGITHLLRENPERFMERPFDVLTPIGGSFNFDPRGAWNALDAGYSPNTHKHGVVASPLVHLLAACGLENTRPVELGNYQIHYCVWNCMLPANLARIAFQGGIPSIPSRSFHFKLALSGKNKIVTFAHEEKQHEDH